MSTPLVTPNLLAQMRAGQAAMPALPAAPVMPSALSLPVPAAPLVSKLPPTQLQRDQNTLDYYKDSGSGVDQIQNPLLRGIARAGDIAASIFVPGIAPSIPGTSLHHQFLVNQAENNLANDQANQKAADASADTESQTQERKSLGNKADALAAADTPMPITPELAEAAGAPQLAGTSLPMKDYQRILANQQTVQGRIQTNQTTNDTRQSISDDKIDAATAAGQAGRDSRESIADAANKTRLLITQMHDSTSRANNANTNDHKGMTASSKGDGNYKVPADVTKRAALANNVVENSDAVDKLIDHRPDIVGYMGGRYTSVQQMIGSDDPAIAELGVRMHNIALASNGAHGVRAQQAIAQTEQELFNHFKSGPNAIHSALDATRSSMGTFLQDEHNYQGTGTRTGTQGTALGAHSGMIRALDPNGVLHEAPAGTPLPKGWKAQ